MSTFGLCHTCYNSNVETILDEFSNPICISCKEELAANRRKEANDLEYLIPTNTGDKK